jgi:hypothetical protein
MTRVNDRTFWSSRGHASPDEYDALTYALAAPACKVVAVKVAPYRALYQDG